MYSTNIPSFKLAFPFIISADTDYEDLKFSVSMVVIDLLCCILLEQNEIVRVCVFWLESLDKHGLIIDASLRCKSDNILQLLRQLIDCCGGHTKAILLLKLILC